MLPAGRGSCGGGSRNSGSQAAGGLQRYLSIQLMPLACGSGLYWLLRLSSLTQSAHVALLILI